MKNTNRLANLTAIAFGVAVTLIIRGYQFGQSNHTIYLLDAMRLNDPRLLANDWFVAHTYQYHFVFAHATAILERLHILRPAFLLGYLTLIVAWHAVWFRTVLALGGSARIYMVSVALFFLSAAGMGLGMYAFLQDASFLPSNIANVAMLWGIYFWLTRRMALSGLLLGVAGFFHLNHALVGMGMWVVLLPFSKRAAGDERTQVEGTGDGGRGKRLPLALPPKGRMMGTIALIALCLPNIIPAARIALIARGLMPLSSFVDLYVRLRHPHHYDPASWPLMLWISFLWPFPLAIIAFRRLGLRRIWPMFNILCLVVAFGLTLAGVWYVSETIVQMSLSRFSIYLKLLSCIGAATYLDSLKHRGRLAWAAVILGVIGMSIVMQNEVVGGIIRGNRLTLAALALLMLGVAAAVEMARPTRYFRTAKLAALSGLILAVLIAGPERFGIRAIALTEDSPDYLAVCDFAREHTPIDATFLVPPSEEQFRLRAQRAIVVNFKAVPQFSGELVEWRTRLCGVLDLQDLTTLPHRFDRTLKAIEERYNLLSVRHLREAASLYHARYVVTEHASSFPPPTKLVFEKGPYHLYDLAP